MLFLFIQILRNGVTVIYDFISVSNAATYVKHTICIYRMTNDDLNK